MRVLRAILAVAAVVACALAAARLVLPRWRCNAEKGRVAVETQRDTPDRAERARELAAVCRRCLDRFPNDYEYAMLLAANEHWLGRRDEAEASYQRALQLNERPEAYAQLALLALERGDVATARRHLMTASVFNLSYSELVGYPLGTEVQVAVQEREKRLRRARRR